MKYAWLIVAIFHRRSAARYRRLQQRLSDGTQVQEFGAQISPRTVEGGSSLRPDKSLERPPARRASAAT